MEEPGTMTVRTVLGITSEILKAIPIYGSELERIGEPLKRAIHNLDLVIDTMDREEAREAEENADADAE